MIIKYSTEYTLIMYVQLVKKYTHEKTKSLLQPTSQKTTHTYHMDSNVGTYNINLGIGGTLHNIRNGANNSTLLDSPDAGTFMQ